MELDEIQRLILDAMGTLIKETMARHFKNQEEMLVLYEKRTMVLENMCRAIEHFNEQKFHTV